MNGRSTAREILVGFVIVATLGGLVALLGVAGGGPGFMKTRRTIDVIFRDGQGIRVGSPVRVAGIDAGQVVDIDLAEKAGTLRARVKIALPVELAKKLRQDVKITIQSGLTGQSRVNIVSSGRSSVQLVAGQEVQGVETTFFDPILEQVGLGPVERSHLSHTIAEVRQTVDTAAPRVRQILGTLQDTASGLKETSETIRPAMEATASNVQDLAKRISGTAPKIETAIGRIDSVTQQAETLLTESRPGIQSSIANAKDLTETLNDIAAKNRGKVETLVDGLNGTRARADRVLYQADLMATQGVTLMTNKRADIERSIANVRDATDWGDKLVQKIYANPFVLSPFYKPTPEDVRVQAVYDTAQVFTKGAQELNDLVKTLDAMQARANSPTQKQDIAAIQRSVLGVTDRLGQTSQMLAEALKRPATDNVRKTGR
jgi:phospholipid/cholesterol/gamma-HCH transport system substrate-binding protein